MDAEANDPARVLIHDDQDPVGPQRCRLALDDVLANKETSVHRGDLR